jgi:hypothetical protein
LVSELIVGRRKSARKSRRSKYPKAFRIVPVRLRAKVPKHAHVIGQAGLAPCPVGSRFAGKISVGSIDFCVYVKEDGAEFLMEC